MGVPKFYRWISERYPKINQVVTDSALLPEFDHLYLDMNGIIHGCTHPSHMDVSDVLSERDMMFGIMHYLDRIITQIVKPKVSVYMAIDGVAPRAKLNQQRSRRFRSAKDLAEATKDKVFSKDEDSGGGVFDSNCITPGTEFMARVSNIIKYFIRKKIKEDPLWRDLKIIFSGHEVPGEGEHKIMQHIRDMRNQPGYQPNTRHCMYGQDADLIMLGLVSHEPHFTLLREIVDFGFNSSSKNTLKTVMKFTKESDFQLLHLSVLREYLQIEFAYGLEDWTYNLESIVDDFVFLTFLVGNDFLPHMPSLDIGDGAFDLLFDTYKAQRPTWGEGQYLTHAGEISDPQRLEAFIAVIGAAETEIFEQREENEAAYTKKKRRWDKRDGRPEGPTDAQIKAAEADKQNDYLSMVEAMMAKHSVNGKFVDGWTPVTNPGQKDFKGRYYFEKLKLTPIEIHDHLALRKSYIEGLLWCLAYYYRGCISWGWYYPYHYGPMLSDLTNLPKVFSEIKFELGEPLKPFEQLMGCLPPASSTLVPVPYRKLMTAPDSPIIGFYPQDFEVDMNGKRNPWEGVNILPFIDVKLLKETILARCPDSALTGDERRRNSLGSVLLYTHDLTANETVPSVNRDIGLIDIKNCNSRVSVVEEPDRTDISFKPELIPGTQIPYPGFPSLNVLPIKAVELVKVGLNCFGSPSKYLNMVLTLHEMPELPPADQIADNILGKSLYINWPMMHEGRVVAVSDAKQEVRMKKKKKMVKMWTPVEAERWRADSEMMVQQYLNGGGIPGSGGLVTGEVQIRLKLVPLQGMKTSPVNGSTKKVFGTEEADVPLQLALWKAPAPDPRFIERGPATLQDRFPVNCNVILTKGKYRGCKATVLCAVEGQKLGVKVEVLPPEPPFGLAIARSVQESYVSSVDAAKVLQLHPLVFSKITGSLLVDPGRYDLGLNLKYKSNLCVLGYTRRRKDSDNKGGGRNGNAQKKAQAWAAGDSLLVVGSTRNKTESGPDGKEERIQWEFTPKAIRLVAAYRQKFPQIFAVVSKYPNERSYDAKKLFGANGTEMLPKVREWLNNIETAKLPRSPTSTEAMPVSAVHAVQRAADVRLAAQKKEGPPKESLIKVPPSALYREGSTSATDVMQASDHNEGAAPELGDRIANLCANGIPFGVRGTVVAIHDPSTGCVEVVMDEEFIGGSTLQGACANFRGKLCVWAHLLKISASDSKGVVDQMIPVGSGKAAIDKLLDTQEKRGKGTPIPSHVTSSWDTQVDIEEKDKASSPEGKTAKEPNGAQKVPAGIAARPITPSRTPIRAGSTGRGRRQGAWKEARGPAENDIGFKGAGRGKKSGMARWQKYVSSDVQTKPNSSVPRKGAEDTEGKQKASATEGLKALLGVEGAAAGAGVQTEARNAIDGRHGSEAPDASAGLKAMLGVSNSVQPTEPPAGRPPPQQQQQQPARAADKLLELMMNKQHQQVAVQPGPGSQRSGFNFTYVEEDKAPPNVPMQPPPPGASSLQPPPGAFHPGMMPPPAYGMPPGAMHPPMMAPPQYAAGPPTGYNPVPPGANLAQFPPLGSNPDVVQVRGNVPDKGGKAEGMGKKKSTKPGSIVPAVVLSKTKK